MVDFGRTLSSTVGPSLKPALSLNCLRNAGSAGLVKEIWFFRDISALEKQTASKLENGKKRKKKEILEKNFAILILIDLLRDFWQGGRLTFRLFLPSLQNSQKLVDDVNFFSDSCNSLEVQR
jgi:hypothetical protein